VFGVALVSFGCGAVRIRAQIEADAALVVLTIEVQIDATETKSSSRPVKRNATHRGGNRREH
jgi:hypothetical protein